MHNLGKFSPVCHFFGYQGRCTIPSRLDQNLATTYGTIARILIEKNLTGFCTSVRGLQRPPSEWFPIAIPFVHMLSLVHESQYGINKPIVRSSLVNLKSESINHFRKKRGLWELNDHYESPGPIQYFGEMNNYVPISLSLEEKYDLEIIEKIEKHLVELKSRSKFGAESKELKIIHSGL